MIRLIIILVLTFALGLVIMAMIRNPDGIGVVAVLILTAMDTGFIFSLVHDKKLNDW